MSFTRRDLPHITQPEEQYFVTYRQKGTYAWEKEGSNPGVLAQPEIAAIITSSWKDLEDRVKLHALCIMSNHVHAVLQTKPGHSLPSVLESHKKFTARRINFVLGRTGPFWLKESFDRILQDGRIADAILYTLMNPVKAGLVSHWRDWHFSYVSAENEWIVARPESFSKSQ